MSYIYLLLIGQKSYIISSFTRNENNNFKITLQTPYSINMLLTSCCKYPRLGFYKGMLLTTNVVMRCDLHGRDRLDYLEMHTKFINSQNRALQRANVG